VILRSIGQGRFDTPQRFQTVWIIAAVAAGLFIATQPVSIVVAAIGIVVFMILTMITPMAALTIMLILSPLRVLIATESPVQLPLDIGQILLTLLLGLWLIHKIAYKRPFASASLASPILIPVLILILVGGLTLFSAISISAWLSEWLKWVQVFLLIMLCLEMGGQNRWQWLLFALITSGTANALVGLYQFLGGSGADHLAIDGRFFRAFGTFGQPNPFGGFMGLLAPIALLAALGYGLRGWHQWRQEKHLPVRWIGITSFYTLTALLIIAGLGTSWSRGAWLGFAVSMLAVIFALPKRTRYSVTMLVLAVGILSALWFTRALPQSIIDRVNSSTAEYFAFDDVRGVDITPANYAIVERLAHWQAALSMARQNFWLGVGFGNYENAYPDYRLINWHEALGHAHNYYLNIWAEAGIIGLLGYSKAWLLVLFMTWRTRQHPDILARCIVVGLFGAWIYLSVHSFTDNLYVNNLFLHLGVMLGITAVLYNQVWKSVGLK
jgi:putative inorganic carbon (hco3(-)) transporter